MRQQIGILPAVAGALRDCRWLKIVAIVSAIGNRFAVVPLVVRCWFRWSCGVGSVAVVGVVVLVLSLLLLLLWFRWSFHFCGCMGLGRWFGCCGCVRVVCWCCALANVSARFFYSIDPPPPQKRARQKFIPPHSASPKMKLKTT